MRTVDLSQKTKHKLNPLPEILGASRAGCRMQQKLRDAAFDEGVKIGRNEAPFSR